MFVLIGTLSLAACSFNDHDKNEETITVIYFHSDDDAERFIKEKAEISKLGAQELIDLLASKEIIPDKIKINHFEQKGTMINLDLSHEFEVYVQTMGTSGEIMVMGSVVNTFLTNFKADQLRLKIDGKDLETGHNIYDAPLKFYEIEKTQKDPDKVVNVNIYHGNSEVDGFVIETVKVEKVEPQILMDLLFEQGALPEKVKVQRFAIDDSNVIHLDLSSEFASMVSSLGTAGEHIRIGSVVNTFLDAFTAEEIYLTVNGKDLETGHNIYDYALKKYE